MRFTVVTLFPEMFESALSTSLLGKAREAGLIEVRFVNPRDYTTDKHRSVDDTPYGGGPGMVMMAPPVVAAVDAATAELPAHRILMSAAGQPLTQKRVQELAERDHLLFVCGRYEGIDERICEHAIDEELSLGDYVLTGGELAAMTMIDAVSRYVPGVLGDAASTDEESHSNSLLEYPQYTRPAEFRGSSVPEVLTSGHHGKIREWRLAKSLERTAERRPDMLAQRSFDSAEDEAWQSSPANWARRCYAILAHHPVVDREGNTVTTSVTNLDLHDLARSVKSYGLAGCIVVTPIESQRVKVDRILGVWSKESYIDNREEALATVRSASSIEEALEFIAAAHGAPVHVVATSAKRGAENAVGFRQLARARAGAENPVALVFGTGWGLHASVVSKAHSLLVPISGRPDFNHLSVRSAVAIILDRLFAAPAQPNP